MRSKRTPYSATSAAAAYSAGLDAHMQAKKNGTIWTVKDASGIDIYAVASERIALVLAKECGGKAYREKP